MDQRLLLRPTWTYLGNGRVGRDQTLVVENGSIGAIGTVAASESDAREIALNGHLLLPGLINAHTHAGPGPIARGIGEDLPLASGAAFYVTLARLWKIAYEDRFRDELRAIVEWDIFGMLRTGTTTIVNQSSVDIDGYFEAVERLGARTYGCPILPLDVDHRLGHVRDGVVGREDRANAQDRELLLHRALFGRYDGSAGGRIRMMLGPASAHTVPPNVLRQVRDMADEFGCPISTHLAQAPGEIVETRQRYGKTPVALLADVGLLGPDLICAHATYVEDDDLPVLRNSGAVVAHCASRKAKEAVISPYQRFIDAGIQVALGTDSFQCDLLEDMKTTALLGKIAVGAVDRPDVIQVIRSATAVAADSLQRRDLGRIEVGATADLVGINLTRPHNAPVFDPLRAAVYYSSGSDVGLVMVDGQVLIENGRSTRVDEVRLGARATAACTRIWADAERQGAIPHAPNVASGANR